MKKLVVCMMVMVMSLSFVACGDNTEQTPANEPTKQAEKQYPRVDEYVIKPDKYLTGCEEDLIWSTDNEAYFSYYNVVRADYEKYIEVLKNEGFNIDSSYIGGDWSVYQAYSEDKKAYIYASHDMEDNSFNINFSTIITNATTEENAE